MSSEEDETLAGMMGVKVRPARWHDVTGKHNAEETLDDDWTYTGAVVAITNGRIFADAVATFCQEHSNQRSGYVFEWTERYVGCPLEGAISGVSLCISRPKMVPRSWCRPAGRI